MFNLNTALSLQRIAPFRVLCWPPTVYLTLQQVIPRALSLVAANTHNHTPSHTHSIYTFSLSSFDIPLYSSSNIVDNTLCSGKVCEIFIGTHAWQNASYSLVAFVVNGFSSRITLRNKQPQSGKTILKIHTLHRLHSFVYLSRIEVCAVCLSVSMPMFWA